MPLQSLHDWNEAARSRYTSSKLNQPNGIACPACDRELCDEDRGSILLSSPPKLIVLCRSCGYRGYRVA